MIFTGRDTLKLFRIAAVLVAFTVATLRAQAWQPPNGGLQPPDIDLQIDVDTPMGDEKSGSEPEGVAVIPDTSGDTANGDTANNETPNGDTSQYVTSDDLAGILSRLDSLESRTQEIAAESEIDFLDSPSEESLRVFNGRLHVDWWDFPKSSPGINLIENGDPDVSPESRIVLRRVRLSIKGKVPPENVNYHLDLEFSGTDRGQVRDAWIGSGEIGQYRTVRIGNQKRPYGLDELNSSNSMIFLERPMVVGAFNEDNRRFGVAAYGRSHDKVFNWRYGLFHLIPIQDSGSIVGNLDHFELSGRLASTLFYEPCHGTRYLHFAVATAVAFPGEDPTTTSARFRTRPEARSASRWYDTRNIAGVQNYEIVSFETVLNLGPLQIGGESMNMWLHRDDRFGSALYLHGGYVYASYFLTGEHLPWNRDLGILGRVKPRENFQRERLCDIRGSGAWQIAGRLSYSDFNDEEVFGAVGRNASVALNWYWNSHTRLQLNYIWGHLDDREVTSMGVPSQIVSGGYEIVGTRLMVDF